MWGVRGRATKSLWELWRGEDGCWLGVWGLWPPSAFHQPCLTSAGLSGKALCSKVKAQPAGWFHTVLLRPQSLESNQRLPGAMERGASGGLVPGRLCHSARTGEADHAWGLQNSFLSRKRAYRVSWELRGNTPSVPPQPRCWEQEGWVGWVGCVG